jgi:hypothetical protein
MKATLEFDLPADIDAYLDAVNGARWREFVRHAQNHVSMWRDIEQDPKAIEVYSTVKLWLTQELGLAGLTHHTNQSLLDEYIRYEKFCSRQVENHNKAQEAADLHTQNANPPLIRPAEGRGPDKKSRKRPAGAAGGEGHNNPTPA